MNLSINDFKIGQEVLLIPHKENCEYNRTTPVEPDKYVIGVVFHIGRKLVKIRNKKYEHYEYTYDCEDGFESNEYDYALFLNEKEYLSFFRTRMKHKKIKTMFDSCFKYRSDLTYTEEQLDNVLKILKKNEKGWIDVDFELPKEKELVYAKYDIFAYENAFIQNGRWYQQRVSRNGKQKTKHAIYNITHWAPSIETTKNEPKERE